MFRRSLQFFTLCFALLFAGSGHAEAQKFNLGIFGGMNASQIDRDGYGGYTKLGLAGGAFVNREFAQDFFWQLELKYSTRGSYYFNKKVVEDFQKTRFSYIELALSVHYLHEEKLQFELGLAPDVLVDFTAWDINSEVPQTEPLGGNRRFGLNALAGFHYWMREDLAVGLRFTYSVIPYALREGAAIRYLDSGYFHNVLCLSLAYRIMHP